ncbi:MAG: hypothetical protein GY854_17880 [Deltaproteobacteria bacterium]|nr:hypothetical protein [Deltaproteobacteria bacterium]
MGPICSVIRVVDGDTIHVRCAGKKESIRLLRINTPERGRPGYYEATEALKELVGKEEVQLLFESHGAAGRDRHGRLLAYVTANDHNLNVEMVRLGWTRFWTRYGEGSLSDLFHEAERKARLNGEGLWTGAGWNK